MYVGPQLYSECPALAQNWAPGCLHWIDTIYDGIICLGGEEVEPDEIVLLTENILPRL